MGTTAGDNMMFNHAISGHTIITNMDGQVTAAASEAADVIISSWARMITMAAK